MKTTFRLFVVAGFLAFQSFVNPLMAQEKAKEDPRIQVVDNQVKIWLFNAEGSNISVKVYDENRRVISKFHLGDGLTVGKILDFNGSDKAYYRLVVLDGKEVLYTDTIQLGTA